jgi:hypothetical protein
MKNTPTYLIILFFCMTSPLCAHTIDFESDMALETPAGFSTALTGNGSEGTWITIADSTAPSRSNVLAQINRDKTRYRFPLCIYDKVIASDVDISVRFKPVTGKIDQAAGLVWRYQNKDNYYVVRANALEDNVNMYKVENGIRSIIDPVESDFFESGNDAPVPTGSWGSLRCIVTGNRFRVYINGKHLFDVEDNTFTEAGKTGLWTKADSYTRFDNLKIRILHR